MFFIGNFRDNYFFYIRNKEDRVVESGGIYRVHCIVNGLNKKCWKYCNFDRNLQEKTDMNRVILLLLQISNFEFPETPCCYDVDPYTGYFLNFNRKEKERIKFYMGKSVCFKAAKIFMLKMICFHDSIY